MGQYRWKITNSKKNNYDDREERKKLMADLRTITKFSTNNGIDSEIKWTCVQLYNRDLH